MAKNPFYTPGPPSLSDSIAQTLRTILATYLQANAQRATIPDAELQALHPLFATPGVWAQLKQDIGL